MTGKEALEYIANLLFMFASTGRHSGKSYTLKALCKIEDDLIELAKYKKAFEILKDKLQLRVEDITKNGASALFVLFNNGNMEIISVDEYELLEELMKDEEC